MKTAGWAVRMEKYHEAALFLKRTLLLMYAAGALER